MKPLFAFLALAALLSAQVNSPRAGVARFADGTIRTVLGLPANLLVSATPLAYADFASFSDAGGLVSRNGLIRLLGPDGSPVAEYASGETAPLLNIDGPLSTTIAWLPSQHALLHWTGHSFSLTEVNISSLGGEATSVQTFGSDQARLLVTHPNASVSAITLSLETGNVVSSDILPAAHGRAFAQHSFVVCENPQGLVVESPDGLSRTVPLSAAGLPAGDLTIERMSSDWLHVSSASTGHDWVLFLNRTNLHLSVLPAPPASSIEESAK
ncbi:MAG TPA: hypothetical protein VGL97_05325 [Bryobacteraceae bacterium]|jgi:hypothetical protein